MSSAGGRATALVDGLEPGGYAVRVQVGGTPPTRQDIACEVGAQAWGAVRPDGDLLARIARLTGGRALGLSTVSELEAPPGQQVSAERHVHPLQPPWVWSLLASVALGLHWLLRRRSGLA